MTYYLTKYEKAKIIGVRAEQLSKGAPPTVDISGLTDAYSIALKELQNKTIPFIIVRNMPAGEKIELKLEDFNNI